MQEVNFGLDGIVPDKKYQVKHYGTLRKLGILLLSVKNMIQLNKL